MAVNKYDVAAVLDLIRPSLVADGGDVKLVDISEDGEVTVQLSGACQGCPLSELTLANGIERILKERVPGVTKVTPTEDSMVGQGANAFGMPQFTDEDDD